MESCANGKTIECNYHNQRTSIAEEVDRCCLKEKVAEEQKKICQTMGWRDYNQGNLSAFDGDLGPVEVKMRQIIQEQDEKKDE